MTTVRNIPDKASSGLSLAWRRFGKNFPPLAFFIFITAVFVLAALPSTDFSPRQAPLAEGDIATSDVVADSTFLFRDKAATALRQENARQVHPLVLELNTLPIERLHEQMQSLLLEINGAHSPEQKEAIRERLARDFGEDVSSATVIVLSSPVVQKAIMNSLLPLAEKRLRSGVLAETGVFGAYPGGAIIRNALSGEETLLQEEYGLPDVENLKLQLSQEINELAVSIQAKKAIALLFEKLLRPTLVPNYDLTRRRADAAARDVEPVMYRVLKGEVIVHQGDRVTRDQQIKMQVLLQRKGEGFDLKKFLGIALCGVLMSVGLLLSPSGRPGSSMNNRDFIFLSILVLVFALLAKGLAAHGEQIAEVTIRFLPESLAWAVPVAGAASLSAQIFSARRYLVTGLLLAFFCTLMMGGGLPLFIFYFLSCMWSTWLTGRASSRQDVVLSVLPLTLGLLAMWAGATLLQGGAHNRYFSEIVAVVTGSFLSMVLTFALAPVVEIIFGYTTRFRLMELLNLEQPLLRDLMITAPGTYHHSLIVSNMCEAGAKRVGAHSLLCKVAALYHDIGKLTKSGYFIENQATEDNPHDRLSPSMSALILVSHVKQGVELAKQHRLGREVTDIIAQHHGNNIIQFFYRKALGMVDAAPPNIEDFRYPGPRPRSREAALVMLADIVEASSRTLDDPTPTRLRQHISDIMKHVYAAGQLDESELTFKDLDVLADCFQQVLRGIFHHRISYPSGAPAKAKPGKPAGGGKPAGEGAHPENSLASIAASSVPQ